MFGSKKTSFNSLLANMTIGAIDGLVRIGGDTQIDNSNINVKMLNGGEETAHKLSISGGSTVDIQTCVGISELSIVDSYVVVQNGEFLLSFDKVIVKKGATLIFSGHVNCNQLIIEKGGSFSAKNIVCPAINLQAGGNLTGFVRTSQPDGKLQEPEVAVEEPSNPV